MLSGRMTVDREIGRREPTYQDRSRAYQLYPTAGELDVWTPALCRIAPDMLSPRAKTHPPPSRRVVEVFQLF